MILNKFWAEGFRNTDTAEISFSPGVNLLHGKNAQGKTNAIEGIYIFSRGKSFRAGGECELVGKGRDGFRIGISYTDKNGENSLEYASFGRQRQRKKNGYKLSSVTEMIGSFKSVLFFPDDLALIKEGPEARRAFLNVAISQCEPTYVSLYADYKRANEAKGGIIKSLSRGGYFDREEILSWSLTMAEYASYIYTMRREYIEAIKPHIKKQAEEISGGRDTLDISYKADIIPENEDRLSVKAAYEKRFTENIEKEIIAGTTLYGPTRDDIEITISGLEARRYASQGQQRSAVLAMKLAEGEVIKEKFGEYPVFLFDDVLSELDFERRKYILSGLSDRQIIITSCSDDEIKNIADRVIEVKEGRYVSSYR